MRNPPARSPLNQGLEALPFTVHSDGTGENTRNFMTKELLIPLTSLYMQRGKGHHLTCTGLDLKHSSFLSLPNPLACHITLIKGQKQGQTDRIANNCFYFYFSGSISELFLQELPTADSLCSLLSPITHFTWLLARVFGIAGSRAHCKWPSPLLSPTVAEAARRVTRG